MLAPAGKKWKLIIFFGVTASLTNFLLGYSNSYPNTAGDSFAFVNGSYAQRNNEPLSQWQFTWFWAGFLNIWSPGYLIGNLLTPMFMDNFGRKSKFVWIHLFDCALGTLLVANSFNFLSAIILVCAVYFAVPELLFLGRLVSSIASSVSFATLIIFLQETAPTNLRGLASSASEIVYLMTSCIGMLLGMDAILGNNLMMLLAVALIPSFASVVTLLPLPESSKYLLIQRKDRLAAAKSLKFYQGNTPNSDAVLNEMLKESTNSNVKTFGALREVLKQPALRRATCIGIFAIQVCVLGAFLIRFSYQHQSGRSATCLQSFLKRILNRASSLVITFINFVSSVVGTFFIEKINRRPLFLRLGIVNTASLAAYVLFDQLAFYLDQRFRFGCIASLVVFAVSYGFALGPIAFFLTSELVSQHFRSLVQSIVFSVNTVMTFLISFSLLPLYRLINTWAFIILLVLPASISLVYLHFNMPETRGKEVHEIVDALAYADDRKMSVKYRHKDSQNMVEIDLNDS